MCKYDAYNSLQCFIIQKILFNYNIYLLQMIHKFTVD